MEEVLRYLKIIRKWWWVIALLCAVTVGTMLVIAFLPEREYEATVTVQVTAPPPQEQPLYSYFGRQAIYDEIEQNRNSFSELLLEADIASRVLRTLPDIPMTAPELREKKMTVDIPEDSQLMHIHVRASDPETAALLANALVEVGLERVGQLRAQSTVNTRQFIEQELEAAKAELEAAEAELMQFQIDNKVGVLNSAMNTQYDVLRSLKTTRDLARAEGNTLKAQAIDEIILKREAELQNLIGMSMDYNRLVSRVERALSHYNFLLDAKTEAQIKENQILKMSFIQVITPARPPERPVSPINNKLIVLGAVGSILAGALLTFLLEYLEVSDAFGGFQKRAESSELVALPDNGG